MVFVYNQNMDKKHARNIAYGEEDVYYIAEHDMRTPRPPLCTAFAASVHCERWELK